MESSPLASSSGSPALVAPTPAETNSMGRLLGLLGVLVILFSLPLWQLFRFSTRNDLYSFTILVPIISGYLIWIERHRLYPGGTPIARVWPSLLGVLGALLGGYALLQSLQSTPRFSQDILAAYLLAFALLVAAGATYFLGRNSLRVVAFPTAFLIFMAPFPIALEMGFESILQHGSSYVAHRLFDLAQMPVYREGTFFQLPGFAMQVAPECSGIRSTLALFLTSLVAGQLFLKSPWKRAVLAAVVLPIALVRNGFRVFVIGELCVQISHDMIHSWVHRRGGPLFFALSLIPFVIILYYLYRSERRKSDASSLKP